MKETSTREKRSREETREKACAEACGDEMPAGGLAFGFDRRPRWAGPWLSGIWLFFLLNPLYEGWQHRDTLLGIGGMVATIAFSAAYMAVWIRARISRFRLIETPPLRFVGPYLGSLVVLGVAMVLCIGEPGIASAVYIAVAIVMCLPIRAVLPVVAVIAVLTAMTGWLPGWGTEIGTAFGVCAAALAVVGMRSVMRRNIDLFRAHQDNTRLALADERNRFARDLHDILGHSLTVITVKAELAGRLLEGDDPAAIERARTEVADLERLSRDALHDVRRAVEGYRELTLPGELARARAALEAAGVTPMLPQSTDTVPTELRELFAWTVREGVTNVIRHAGARECRIVLTATSAEVRDDGRCDRLPREGSGLTGLRERASVAGAVLTTRVLAPGFSLQVALP